MTTNRYMATYPAPRVEHSPVMAEALRQQIAARVEAPVAAVALPEVAEVNLQSVVDAGQEAA